MCKLWNCHDNDCHDCKRKAERAKKKPLKRTPLKKKVYKIKRESDKMKRDKRVYRILRIIFLSLFTVCEVCKKNRSTQVHHKRGRGIYLLVVETWLAICGGCHNTITEKSKQAVEDGFSERRNVEISKRM